jgi:D-serine deaminase-like pyridoxal phosphate-dependent protein
MNLVTSVPLPAMPEADTPALLVDLDRVERNIERMQSACERRGLAFRPHIKTHKLPQIAHMQLRAGAAGVACQKLGEAEVMADAGVADIMLTFPIIGAVKASRLARLAERVRLSTVADSEVGVRGLSQALAEHGGEVDLLVECDTGFGRTGVQSPDDAADLAELAASLPGLRFAGLMTYPTQAQTAEWIARARAALAERGLQAQRVSGGGTATAFDELEGGEVTELRAGTYVYGDRACVANGTVPLDSCAAVVRATVVSRPTAGRAILDAGSKALTSDPAAGADVAGFGLVIEHPEAEIYRLSEEHGHVDVSRCERPPRIGDVVSVLPNHACVVTNLYDDVVVHRSGVLEGVWPVAARGLVS